MSKAERADIGRVVRLRAKVARNEVDALKAARVAQFEEELAAVYRADCDLVRDLLSEAQTTARRLDAELAERCRERGIREEFRPRITGELTYRGENAHRERRAELRKVATTRADADARSARNRIDRWEAETTTGLIATGLDSEEARAFLDSLPAADQLLPALSLAELEADLDAKRGRG